MKHELEDMVTGDYDITLSVSIKVNLEGLNMRKQRYK